jgi:hypothetical protein
MKLKTALVIGAVGVAAACNDDSTAPRSSPQKNDAAVGDAPLPPGPCTAEVPDACPSKPPSYTTDVIPILNAKCASGGCHDGHDGGPWPLTNHEDVDHWRAFIISDLAKCSMPPATSSMRITESEQKTLIDWLVCGAPVN